MRSRSRSLLLFSVFSVAMTASLLTAGCKSKPKTELRLPRTSAEAGWSATNTDIAATTGTDGPGFGTNAWAPGSGAPGESTIGTSGMIPGNGGFGAADAPGVAKSASGPANAAAVAARDGATGDFVNSADAAGVENGQFTSELEMIHFAFDSSEIAPEFQTVLEGHSQWLTQNSKVMVQVEGHCDEKGTEEYNIALGQKRADAVRAFLIEKGIDANRISTISYGKMRPLSFDLTEEASMLNRRAMFMVFETAPDNSVASATIPAQ